MRWLWRALALSAILLPVSGYLWVRGTLPVVDGRIVVAGPAAPIEIVRDRHGVPHVFARSEADAYFALGFVHAQDRLWQMEINRRIGAGRLAEVLGRSGRGYDAFMRTMSLYHYAERTFANLDRETRAVLEAYARGVNAFIESRRLPGLPLFLRLQPEFQLFLHSPEPWRPADSLVWLKVMAWELGGNWRSEALRGRLFQKLSPAQIGELLPPYPGDEPVPLPDLGELYAGLPLAGLSGGYPPPLPESGSNAWVVAGSLSETGKPLLANDPHLRLSAPSVWYFAHLRAPGLNVIGGTLPGVPAIVVGRNDDIAWGASNTGPDVQDLYVERLDPDDPGRYLAPGGPRPFEVRDEVIRVRGGADVAIRVRSTRHGPVMSDVSKLATKFLDAWQLGTGDAGDARDDGAERAVLAIAWTALSDDDKTMQAARKLARARDWREFTEALRDYHVPQQTILYADREGNIGMYAPGRVPIRAAENDLHGLLPAPGWEAAYDWQGFIPFEQLPHSFNPARGRIVAANQKIVPQDYPHHITSDWATPFRARRIGELLGARPAHSLSSFMALQGDVRSPLAALFLPFLLAVEPADSLAAAALARLEAWDGAMGREQPEPLIFAAWYRELTRLVYADELGPLFEDGWGQRPVFMHDALSRRRHWCDDVATPRREGCEERIAAALEAALAALAERYGNDIAAWRWGEAHYAHSSHRPFSLVPILASLFDVRLAADGNAYTVNAALYKFSDEDQPFAYIHGPAMRAIYDLDEPERSLFVLSTGQSGNVFSGRYADLAERWRDLDYIPMITDRGAVEVDAMGTLVLVPAAAGEAEPGR